MTATQDLRMHMQLYVTTICGFPTKSPTHDFEESLLVDILNSDQSLMSEIASANWLRDRLHHAGDRGGRLRGAFGGN